MTLPSPLPRLLVLTDRSQLPAGRDLADTVRACAEAGVRAFVVREHDLPVADRQVLLDTLRDCDATLITSRTRLPGADGVHLAADQEASDAGDAPFHGRSCHVEADARHAVAAGAAYVTISPFAATASKPGYGPALGVGGVRRAVGAADGVPVYALGGIDPAAVPRARDAGAHGVAVMGTVMRSHDPAAVCRALLAAR